MELDLVFCETCNCSHSVNSASCLSEEFQSLADASTYDLLRFEEELEDEDSNEKTT